MNAKRTSLPGAMLYRRVLLAAFALFVGGCGGSGDIMPVESADVSSSVDRLVEVPVGSDPASGAESYAALATYRCDYLMGLIEEISGPGDRSPQEYEDWAFAGGMAGGCVVFGEDRVAIEIHVAEPDSHSAAFAMGRPVTAEGREKESAEIGDEAYVDPVTHTVVARRGLVEVLLRDVSDGTGRDMELGDMAELAAAILAPWPSGSGPESAQGDSPPDLPIPVGADAQDWLFWDPEAYRQGLIDQGFEAPDPGDLGSESWGLPWLGSVEDAQAYCDVLRSSGFRDHSDEFDEAGCFLTDSNWLVVVASNGETASVAVSLLADE